MAIHQSSEQQRKTMTMKETTLEQTEMKSINEETKVIAASEEHTEPTPEEVREQEQKDAVRAMCDKDVAFALKWHQEKGMKITPEFKTSVEAVYKQKYKLA